jgi:hypothetical protein
MKQNALHILVILVNANGTVAKVNATTTAPSTMEIPMDVESIPKSATTISATLSVTLTTIVEDTEKQLVRLGGVIAVNGKMKQVNATTTVPCTTDTSMRASSIPKTANTT